jgi:murein DD-endopeptidase MepM/ murein hydrolase activator NlpD
MNVSRRRLFVGVKNAIVPAIFVIAGFVLLKLPLMKWEPATPMFVNSATALETASAGPLPEDHLNEVHKIHLQPGQQMTKAFQEAGVVAPDLTPAVKALSKAVDFRRIRSTDLFILYRSRQGKLRRLEYDRGGTTAKIVLEQHGNEFQSFVEPKHIEHVLRKMQGVVASSLYESMAAIGGDANLIVSFADLFAWDFDFFTDTRNGDRFDMLVEEIHVDGKQVSFGRILAGRYWPVGQTEPLDAYLHNWNPDESSYYTHDGRSVRKFFLKSPLNYRRISSTFTYARFHPIFKTYRPHLGVDYAAPTGTPVVALGSGRVCMVTWRTGFGRTVQIRHNSACITQYAHLSAYAKGLHSGDRVKQGEVIGYVGQSGHATGPHLDFRVQMNGKWVNPLGLKRGESSPLPDSQKTAFAANVSRWGGLLDELQAGATIRLDENGNLPAPATASARVDTQPTS